MAKRWQNDKPFASTNLHMLNEEIMCDVTFLVGETERPLKAHKFILASRSSVFNTMFCGLLAESGDAIKIPDIEAEIFTHMLRYLYTGNCDKCPDTVLSLMYAAYKYDVANLVSECSNYLERNITLRNVFIIFEQSQIFNNKILTEACINFMNKDVKQCLESDGFLSLSKQTLCTILSYDKVVVPEEDVYSACVKWAKEECRRTDQDPSDANCREALGDVVQQDPSDVNCREALGDVVQLIQDPSDANCREALGDVVQLIRFPLMPMNTFSWTVSTENILTTEEKVSLFQYFAGGDNKPAHSRKIGMFSCKPRFTPRQVVFRPYNHRDRYWPQIGKTDAISFYSSKDTILKGVGLYLPKCEKGMTSGLLEVFQGDKIVLLSMHVTLRYEAGVKHSEVMFDEPINLQRYVRYTIAQTFRGDHANSGSRGPKTATNYQCDLTLTFIASGKSTNRTGLAEGQFRHFTFMDSQ